ncbi:50S ribosomal protein L24 domain protein [Prevotella disiens JCM 6334 = ATCC 29426]|nr:50S ribosomal protein L24 domain protein [Prevotella disiens JCM 6334 = ATCC 29426]
MVTLVKAGAGAVKVGSIALTPRSGYFETKELKERYCNGDTIKADTCMAVAIYMSERELDKDFEVVAFGSYYPWLFPLVRTERTLIGRNLLKKAVRHARKLNANGVIIDTKNDFRIINVKL